MRGYQFVWWGWRDWRLGFVRFDSDVTNLALIYVWTISLGPLEVRRWARRP